MSSSKEKVPRLSEFTDKYAIVLEVKLSRLSPRVRAILAARVAEAINRHVQRLHHLSVMAMMLSRKPLSKELLELYKEIS